MQTLQSFRNIDKENVRYGEPAFEYIYVTSVRLTKHPLLSHRQCRLGVRVAVEIWGNEYYVLP